jgi:hypothetical protein
MSSRFRYSSLLLFLLLCARPIFASPPILFFADIIHGPNSGNSDSTFSTGGGVYVTLYGQFLGAAPTVTLNGSACLVTVSQPSTWRWYQRMVVQLTSGCTSGNWGITTPGGTWSGPMVSTLSGSDFTIQTGNIYYISTAGNNGNTGTFSSPWLTIPFAVQHAGLVAGNIIYAENGVQQTADDGQTWNACLTIRSDWSQGTANQPNALIGYPGATVQIGPSTLTTPQFGIRSTDFTATPQGANGYWTFAEITIRGGSSAIGLDGGVLTGGNVTVYAQNWRVIGNDISNAQSTGSGGGGAAFDVGLSQHVEVLGNYLHDLNLHTTNNLQQGMYFSTDANFVEFGWNETFNSAGRAALQTHSSPLCVPACGVTDSTGLILHDYSIHDNKLHDCANECLLLDTLDPSVGSGVKAYNNLIYNCAQSSPPTEICAHTQLSGDYNAGPGGNDFGSSPPPTWFYFNTVVGSATSGSFLGVWGDNWPDVHAGGQTYTARASSNILFTSSSAVPYLRVSAYSGSSCSNTDNFVACPINSGDKNIMFGNGVPTFPNIFTNSINSDPLFVSVSGHDFHLGLGSPAIGAGLHTVVDQPGGHSIPAPVYDLDGNLRANPPAIGAYELAGAAPPTPNAISPLAAFFASLETSFPVF